MPQTCTRDVTTSSVHMKGKIPRTFPKKTNKANILPLRFCECRSDTLHQCRILRRKGCFCPPLVMFSALSESVNKSSEVVYHTSTPVCYQLPCVRVWFDCLGDQTAANIHPCTLPQLSVWRVAICQSKSTHAAGVRPRRQGVLLVLLLFAFFSFFMKTWLY